MITFLIQFFVACIATTAFAILFSAPTKELPFCGFIGALGWIVYYVLTISGLNSVVASLIATLILSIFARAFAVTRRTPVTVYLLSGIFPLVPGAGIYYTAYYLFQGEHSLSGEYGLLTFETAAAIVFGIIFGFSVPQAIFHRLASLLSKK